MYIILNVLKKLRFVLRQRLQHENSLQKLLQKSELTAVESHFIIHTLTKTVTAHRKQNVAAAAVYLGTIKCPKKCPSTLSQPRRFSAKRTPDSKEQPRLPSIPQAESEYVRDRVPDDCWLHHACFPSLRLSLVLCEGNCDDSVPKSGFLWQRVSPPPPHSACCRTNALFPGLNGPAPNHPHANSSVSPRSSDHTAMRIEAIFTISTHIRYN